MPCDNVPEAGEPQVCEVGGSGLFLPLGGDNEQMWNSTLRGILYLLGLLWCFAGVALIADIFMSAIEKITSKKVLVKDAKLGKMKTVSVWNPTVANLTLMALGSSAPEILLNVIGIFPTFLSGDLGPSTIVGSAAFNLLMIIAVCVVAIPGGEVRKIKDLGVFSITAFFSVFAYVWLLVILLVISKDVVEMWEGCLTFAFFWVLVVLAYLADAGKLPGTAKPMASYTVHPQTTNEELAVMEMEVRKKYGKNCNLTHDQVASLMEYEYQEPRSRAQMRCSATRSMFGGKNVLNTSRSQAGGKLAMELTLEETNKKTDYDKPHVEFAALNYTVLESVGTVDIAVKCVGPLRGPISVDYESQDGTAKAGDDYDAVKGSLDFAPGKTEQTIKVKIAKSEGYEHTEQFYVVLKAPAGSAGFDLGENNKVTIVIIDEDHPGLLAFEEEQTEVKPCAEDVDVPITVHRKHGTSGKVTCSIFTESDSAIGGKDFEALPDGTVLEFAPGQKTAHTKVKVFPNSKYESTEIFRVILKDPTGGAAFDNTTDGGDDSCIMTVRLLGDTEKKSFIEKIAKMVKVNHDVVELGNKSYKEQFVAAVYVGGSPEAQKEAGALDWVMHFISLPWKVLFATTPPTEYAGGWLCFCVALGYVGLVTCIIGDLAELLGCVWGIKPSTTAVTLVAVGTSLPDTFASKSAAQMDPYADNSIGNVTGSNSVNVFLGLGLPWMIAAIYWTFIASCEPGDKWSNKFPVESLAYPNGIFVVQAGSLATSVIAFSGCAVVCLATLEIRRTFLGGELGGPKAIAVASAVFFVSLWVIYLVCSIVLSD